MVAPMLMHALKAAATCAALAIYYTPLQTARKIRRDQNVGALSPLPFACIVANCSVWVLYGVIGRDWVPMVASNAVGVASGERATLLVLRAARIVWACSSASRSRPPKRSRRSCGSLS